MILAGDLVRLRCIAIDLVDRYRAMQVAYASDPRALRRNKSKAENAALAAIVKNSGGRASAY